MLEIVKNLKPDFVVCENVEGLRSMLNGKVESKIIQDYKAAGYEMNVAVLNSADYYVPQIRKRVIFIGNRIGARNSLGDRTLGSSGCKFTPPWFSLTVQEGLFQGDFFQASE